MKRHVWTVILLKLERPLLQTGWESSLGSKPYSLGWTVVRACYTTIDERFSYREQIEKVSRLKEETIRGIIKNSHDIAIFKEEVSRHLRELRDFAEGE